MTYIVSSGALNTTHSLTHYGLKWTFMFNKVTYTHIHTLHESGNSGKINKMFDHKNYRTWKIYTAVV